MDLKTLFFIQLIVNVNMGLIYGLLSVLFRGFKAPLYMLIQNLLYILAIYLYANQNNLPVFAGFILSNTIAVFSNVLVLAAVDTHLGRERPAWFYASISLAAFVLIIPFTYIWDSVSARFIIISFFNGFLFLMMGLRLAGHLPGRNSLPYRFAVFVTLAMSLALSLRMIFAVLMNIFPAVITTEFIWNYALTVVILASLLMAAVFITMLMADSKSALEMRLEEIEHSRKNLDRLLSILSHDLKGTVSVIENSLSLYLEKEAQEFDNKRLLPLRKIRSLAGSQTVMLSNLLTWMKTQKGTIKAVLEIQDISKILNELADFYGHMAENKQILMTTAIQSPCVAYADKEMLKAVIRNILSNAVKFTESGGRISLSAGCEQEHAIITVSDNGVGFNTERYESRPHTMTTLGTGGEPGTGLGLALSREFIKDMGGVLKIESALGKGTTVNVYLPIGKVN